MSIRLSKVVPGLLLLMSLVSIACSDSNPADVTGPTDAAPLLSLSAEPPVVSPEFLPPIGTCNVPRFRTRFVVILGGFRGFVVQSLHVSFVDRQGVSVVPIVVPSPAFAGPTVSGARIPVTLPSSAPIQLPMNGPIDGLSVPMGGTQQVPITLEFTCHARSRGTIFVDANTRDNRGQMGRSRLSVQVGE